MCSNLRSGIFNYRGQRAEHENKGKSSELGRSVKLQSKQWKRTVFHTANTKLWMYPCQQPKAQRKWQGGRYRRQGTTGANEKAGRSHKSPIVPQVVGEAQSERANVGKGRNCNYGTTKLRSWIYSEKLLQGEQNLVV
jgi:hypothetical protein